MNTTWRAILHSHFIILQALYLLLPDLQAEKPIIVTTQSCRPPSCPAKECSPPT